MGLRSQRLYSTRSTSKTMNQELKQEIQEQQAAGKTGQNVGQGQLSSGKQKNQTGKESKNIWIVVKKWCGIRWNEELDDSKVFEYSATAGCIHFFSADVYIFAGEKFEFK